MIFETLSFNPGDFILKEGDIGKGFYILETGELEVTRDDKVINEITLAGAMFGELSELLCNKRDASIRAKTGAKVKYFDMELSEFVEKNPKFAVKIIRNLGRRLCRMNAVAIQGNTRNDFLKNITNPENSAEENRTSRLLVVDDKPMIIDQIKEFAKEPGWEVEGTGDIEEAIVLSENYDFNTSIETLCSVTTRARDFVRGARKIGECYTPGQEVKITLGVSPKTTSAAQSLKQMMSKPQTGTSSPSYSPAGAKPGGVSGFSRFETDF